MRLYKAVLNDNYDVISYEKPNEIESVFSTLDYTSTDIDKETLKEYIELVGYLTVHNEEKNPDSPYIMYLDLDFKFNSIWDGPTSIYVTDQIIKDIRENLMFSILEEGMELEQRTEYIHFSEGIVGESEITEGDLTYVYHKYLNGIWSSSDPNVISVDKYNGVVRAKKVGKSTISYVVDSGTGILTCFKTIAVNKFIPKALLA